MKFLTTPEVAEQLRTSAKTVRYWRWQGTGPKAFKAGRRVLYAAEDVQAWIDQQYDRRAENKCSCSADSERLRKATVGGRHD